MGRPLWLSSVATAQGPRGDMAGMETGTGDRGHVVKIILKSAYGV